MKTGRRIARVNPFSPPGSGKILSLADVCAAVPPKGERYLGVCDVALSRLLGTEGRSQDFSPGFFPLHPWMRQRWEAVRDNFLSERIPGLPSLLEYGDYYFVRDGNHRVSAARCHEIEYLNAEVTLLEAPVRLWLFMDRGDIPLLRAKAAFEAASGALSILGDDLFSARRPRTYEILQHSILVAHRDYFRKVRGREAEPRELVLDWNDELYSKIIEFIKREALSSLFPGQGATDIFCLIMEDWGKLAPNTWFDEAYREFLSRAGRHTFLRRFLSQVQAFGKSLARSASEERDYFLLDSSLLRYRPQAEIPAGKAPWYRFLEAQFFGPHFRYLRARLGRLPRIDELAASWYDDLFLPVLREYQRLGLSIDFSSFYMGLMRVWGRRVLKKKAPIGIEEAIGAYIGRSRP